MPSPLQKTNELGSASEVESAVNEPHAAVQMAVAGVSHNVHSARPDESYSSRQKSPETCKAILTITDGFPRPYRTSAHFHPRHE